MRQTYDREGNTMSNTDVEVDAPTIQWIAEFNKEMGWDKIHVEIRQLGAEKEARAISVRTYNKLKTLIDRIDALDVKGDQHFKEDAATRKKALDEEIIDKERSVAWEEKSKDAKTAFDDFIYKMRARSTGYLKEKADNIEKFVAAIKSGQPIDEFIVLKDSIEFQAKDCDTEFTKIEVKLSKAKLILDINLNLTDDVVRTLHSDWKDAYAEIENTRNLFRDKCETVREALKALEKEQKADIRSELNDKIIKRPEARIAEVKLDKKNEKYLTITKQLRNKSRTVLSDAKSELKASTKDKKTAREERETLIKKYKTELSDLEIRLKKEVQDEIAKYFGKKAKKLVKSFGALVKLSGGKVDRKDADLTGAGTVKLRTRAQNVPPAVIEPISAQIEAIRLMGRTGVQSAEDLEIMREMQSEVEKSIADATRNLAAYKEIADLTRGIEKKLADDEFVYASDSYWKLTDKLKVEKDKAGSAVTAELLEEHKENLVDLETEVDAALAFIQGNKKTFNKIQKMHDKTREESLKKYNHAFRKVAEAYSKTDAGKKDDAIKKLAHSATKDYQGKYATEFSDIWSKVSIGEYVTVDAAKFATIALAEKIDEVVKELNEICDGGADELDTSAGTVMGDALKDFKNSGNEMEDREKAKKEFKESYAELKGFIDSEEKNLVSSAQAEFKNNTFLLKVLDRRFKAATSSGEMKALQRELFLEDKVIRGYAERNKKYGKEEGVEKVESVFKNCTRNIRAFRTDLGNFYKESVAAKANMDFLDEVIESEDASSKTAQAVKALITEKKSVLDDFVTAISSAMDGDNLGDLYEEFKKAKTSLDKIKVREKTLAVIRRRRLFLEETKLGLNYRGNPFDSGKYATIMIHTLASAESQLLTLIKPH